MKDLPLNGRSYDSLMTLNPAVVNYTSERSGRSWNVEFVGGQHVHRLGRRPQENLFLLNGIEYTGASEINNTPGGASGQLLGVEAVREFNVVTDTYGAEYGKRPGARLASLRLQDRISFMARYMNFCATARSTRGISSTRDRSRNSRETNSACRAADPIRKDKLFLFGNYEGYRQKLGLSDVTLVPDAAARQGYLPGPGGMQSFVGLAAGVAPLLALWPAPNGPDLGSGIAEAFSHPVQTIREDFGTLRFDYNLGANDTLFAVYTVDDSYAGTPTVNPLSRVVEGLREQVGSVQEQHLFSSTILNTARIGFSRGGYFFTGIDEANLPGWVGNSPIGAVVIGGGTASNGASQISLAGTNAGSNLRAVRNLFTYDDHIAVAHGIHEFSAGIWFQRRGSKR